MPTLSDLVNKKLHVSVQWGSETVNVTYRPFTEIMRKSLADKPTLYQELEAMVVEWDITEDGEEMAPINVETFNRLPSALLKAIDVAIGADQYGRGESNANRSATIG